MSLTARDVPVGIDDIHVFGGSLRVPAHTIVAASAAKSVIDVDRLELRERSLPTPWEDPVTLAVEAARPIVKGRDIGLCLVATESSIDDAKPLSSYVHHWLGLRENCRHAEIKHACYGGTVALRLAADWVRANPGETALVIATDMARRLFDDTAEAAEGAGAVAMIVSADPKVFVLGRASGVAAREIYDVMRPTRKAEVIHSGKSLAAYLDLLEASWERYAAAAGPDALSELEFMLYHTPLIALVKQGHALVAGQLALGRSFAFDDVVRPSLAYGQALGNTYSGSLYVALACLADQVTLTKTARVGLYSYGSGSCAEVFDGWLLPTARAIVLRHGIAAKLAERVSVDAATYRAIVLSHEASLADAHYEPDLTLPTGIYDTFYAGRERLVLQSVRDHYRGYRWS